GLDRGAALVKQIMAFSRKQPAEMASLDLNAVITGTQVMLDVVLEKKIRLKFSLAPGLPPINGNKGQLEQILVNLAVNARDAIYPEAGELSITTAEVTGDVAAHCAKELGGVAKVIRLSVSDTGRGMPQEVIEHVLSRSLPPSRKARAPAWASPPFTP
ncbi:MAG: ATP-binding protein, partial [Elusimicrobiota bacterium]|nr:ATP-binding protein [Elusimicrobiota bacterium]